jgi:hypothetical protein
LTEFPGAPTAISVNLKGLKCLVGRFTVASAVLAEVVPEPYYSYRASQGVIWLSKRMAHRIRNKRESEKEGTLWLDRGKSILALLLC